MQWLLLVVFVSDFVPMKCVGVRSGARVVGAAGGAGGRAGGVAGLGSNATLGWAGSSADRDSDTSSVTRSYTRPLQLTGADFNTAFNFSVSF